MRLHYLVVAQILSYSYICSSMDQLCPNDMVVVNGNLCIDRFEFPNKRGEKPLVSASAIREDDNVLYFAAENLCKSVGKRMCTRKEWVNACKGPNNSIYPYGDKPDTSTCNTNKYWRAWDIYKVALRDNKTLKYLDQSEPSGARETCVSAVGAYDMVGNAEEWVKCDTGKYGYCLVGGYWVNEKPPSCTHSIIVHAGNWNGYATGFRCCQDIK